jgi:hypothetical protein
MNDLDRSIIATLAYYGAFDWPLTLVELREKLIPATRLGGSMHTQSASDVLERVDVLRKIGTVACEHGLYRLTPVPQGFGDQRIAQEKIWAQKWKRMLRRARWLQVVPFVRAICASGSLALGNMSEKSDWDMFIVARTERLYTARIGLLVSAWLMRSLRTKNATNASDTFCFNHYVTTGGLAIRHRSLYVAHGLAMLVPLHDPYRYTERLWQTNQWIGDAVPHPVRAEYARRMLRPSRILGFIRELVELMLWTPLGWALEYGVRTWQQRRIAREPATYAGGGRVVADGRELEFHPRSFEAVALARYNAVLEKFGMDQYAERDSGLTR